MSLRTSAPWALGVSIAAFLSAGCVTGGALRSAKTLEPGVGELGLGWTATHYSLGDSKVTDPSGAQTVTKNEGSLTLPNLIPEVSYHLGIAENVELGGRVSIGALTGEIDGKFRFLRTGGLHLAVAPGIAFTPLGFTSILQLTAPVIATYEVTPSFAVTACGKIGYWYLTDASASTDSSLAGYLAGSGLFYGGAVGLDFHGSTFAFRPFVDFTRIGMSSSTNQGSGQTKVSSSLMMTTFGFAISLAFGREMKKLEKMDERLDRMERKLDQAAPPPPAPQGAAPAAPSPTLPPPPPAAPQAQTPAT